MTLHWRKSSYSGQEATSDCVEVASAWRKSSYSGSEATSTCVEVAEVWHKSSHSGSQASSECVEVAEVWQKSSHSTSEATSECVEVAGGIAILVRDSKNVEGPRLEFGRGAFRGLVDRAKRGELDR